MSFSDTTGDEVGIFGSLRMPAIIAARTADMQEHQTRVVHEGPVFSVETLTFEEPDEKPVRKDIVRHPGAVLVIAVDSDDRLVMIRNFRVSIDRWLLEFCAGKLEPGELPEQAARRELIEECGCEAGSLTLVGDFLTSPGFCDERIHVFLARDLRDTGRQLEPGERIEVVRLTIDELEVKMRSGEFEDGKSIAALTLWQRGSDDGKGVA